MTTQEAAKTLSVVLPTTSNALRTAFRRQSRLEHPDTSKHPEAAARFRKVVEAYGVLKVDSSALELSTEEVRTATTTDGTSLSELGNGLGFNINGIECDDCKGQGYRRYTEGSRHRCPACFDPFPWNTRAGICKKCRGTGRFVRNGEDRGICFTCQGSGRFKKVCPICRGSGFIDSGKPTCYYVKCAKCEGCGETRIFNPVLPKGLLL